MRTDKRKRENSRERSKPLVRKDDKDNEVLREAREIESNGRAKAVG